MNSPINGNKKGLIISLNILSENILSTSSNNIFKISDKLVTKVAKIK